MSRACLMPALLLFACADQASSARDQAREAAEEARLPVIYGEDDRHEVFEHARRGVHEFADNALVALVPKALLTLSSGADSVTVSAESLGAAQGLCASERFIDQPTAAECSGVLIAPDLVLTAAHCFEHDRDCERYAYVFDYRYVEAGRFASIERDDVWSCKEIVLRRLSDPSAPLREDFAVVRLDHPVGAERIPVTMRRGPMHLREPVTVLGFPSGVPAKVDDGAVVRSARAGFGDYFALDSDTFRGSSGSPVLDANDRLAGIVVRGGVDYVDVADAGCAVARKVVDEPRSEWEHATYATRVLDALCEDPRRAPALCNAEPVCGDGVCERSEAGACPADCIDMCSLSLCKTSQESERPLASVSSATEDGDDADESAPPSAATGTCSLTRSASDRAGLWLAATLAVLAARRRAHGQRRRGASSSGRA